MTTRGKHKPLTRGQQAALRTAVADYMYSEGCSCCENREAHDAHRQRLGELLGVQPKKDIDGSLWYDFTPFRTDPS